MKSVETMEFLCTDTEIDWEAYMDQVHGFLEVRHRKGFLEVTVSHLSYC